ncbi:MAG: adenosylcobinamide-GDP ribazoletransferase [Desulfurivibrionaceae bacterium]|nr:adenosylcobinamide-GDP ribazoletransferase [Desulfurivibrionaceae bacterium]
MCKPFWLALSFLTILPLAPPQAGQDDMERSILFFPAAGLVIGGLLALVAWLGLYLGMSSLALAVVLVGGSAWLSRGLHLDGVADLCDGFGGSFDIQRRLAIMKDSHVGAFGVVGLVMVLLLKTAGLQALLAAPENLLLLAMVPAAARFAMLVTAFRARYPRSSGTGHFVVGKVSLPRLLAAALFLAPLALCGWSGLGLLLVCLLPPLGLRFQANKGLGGVTGDVLGAAIEWSEAAGWLAAALLSRGAW